MKSLEEIKAANALSPKTPEVPPVSVLDEAHKALLVARASLRDVLDRPIPVQQARNIMNVDLPIIERAIKRLQPL